MPTLETLLFCTKCPKISCIFKAENTNETIVPARLGTFVYHIFMATIVLVVDPSFNKIEGFEGTR